MGRVGLTSACFITLCWTSGVPLPSPHNHTHMQTYGANPGTASCDSLTSTVCFIAMFCFASIKFQNVQVNDISVGDS
ncbi:hypothetical protein RRG08_002758 [Elysia crispata]|uniref:Secreted protein n=1 Tax=Elysia crispata TaxID=231223 RepID=A0AAE0XU05_9GAST|nr:hypothetical protein RRG08_002758 [Elysia crispata]